MSLHLLELTEATRVNVAATRPVTLRVVAAALALVFLLLPRGLRGELLVTTSDGGRLEVTSYETDGRWARLHLAGGSMLTLPLSRIERVVDEAPDRSPAEIPEIAVELEYRTDQGVPATPFGRLIYDTARRHGVNPEVVAAVAETESSFDPEAVSQKGAVGLLQLMPATAERFGVDENDLTDPARNLDAGSRYLAWLIDRYGDDSPLRVLAAYNAGEAAVDRHDGVPPFRETREYLRRIARNLRRGAPFALREDGAMD